jgi:hypothetical protein
MTDRLIAGFGLIVATFMTAVGSPAAAQSPVQDFYAGRQITVIVGAGAGGYSLVISPRARQLSGRGSPSAPQAAP